MDVLATTILFVFVAAFTATFVFNGYYLFRVSRLQNYLKTAHQVLWKELGEPHLIWNNGIKNTTRFLGWINKREFVESGNQELNDRCEKFRSIMRGGIVLNGLMFVLFFAMVWALRNAGT